MTRLSLRGTSYRVAWPFGLAAAGLALGLLIALLPVPQLVLVAGALFIVGGSIFEPLIGIGAALLLGPLRAWLEIRMPGVAPYIGQLVLAMAVIIWLARGMVSRRLVVTWPPKLGFLVAFLAFGLLSLWNPVDIWSGALELVKWIQVVLVAVIVYSRLCVVPGETRPKLILWLLVGSAAVQAVIGLWQFALRGSGVEQFAINDQLYRAYGTFQQPNPFAGLVGMVGALLVGLTASEGVRLLQGAVRGPKELARVCGLVLSTALVVLALGASWSRGGWMGFAAAILVMAVLLPKRSVWGIGAAGAGVALGGGLYAMGRLPSFIVDRLTGVLAYVRFEDVRGIGITDANFSLIERMAHWQAALGMWRSRFWFGVGLGGYEGAYPAHRLINWPLPLGHAHNFYLNLLAEVGVLGLGAYLVWLGVMVVSLIVAIRRSSGWLRGLALGLLGGWIHYAVHSLVDNLLVNNVHLHLGVMVALTAWVVAEGPSRRPR